MSDPFLGEVRLFGGTFPPIRWADCDGAVLSIAQYDALFSLIGTTYGGDGVTTFALPDLRGRTPIGHGQGPGLPNFTIGERAGTETVTLNVNQMPFHTHLMLRGGTPNTSSPRGAYLADARSSQRGVRTYAGGGGTQLHPATIATAGASQPHENMQPFLAIRFIIALDGIYPSRS